MSRRRQPTPRPSSDGRYGRHFRSETFNRSESVDDGNTSEPASAVTAGGWGLWIQTVISPRPNTSVDGASMSQNANQSGIRASRLWEESNVRPGGASDIGSPESMLRTAYPQSTSVKRRRRRGESVGGGEGVAAAVSAALSAAVAVSSPTRPRRSPVRRESGIDVDRSGHNRIEVPSSSSCSWPSELPPPPPLPLEPTTTDSITRLPQSEASRGRRVSVSSRASNSRKRGSSVVPDRQEDKSASINDPMGELSPKHPRDRVTATAGASVTRTGKRGSLVVQDVEGDNSAGVNHPPGEFLPRRSSDGIALSAADSVTGTGGEKLMTAKRPDDSPTKNNAIGGLSLQLFRNRVTSAESNAVESSGVDVNTEINNPMGDLPTRTSPAMTRGRRGKRERSSLGTLGCERQGAVADPRPPLVPEPHSQAKPPPHVALSNRLGLSRPSTSPSWRSLFGSSRILSGARENFTWPLPGQATSTHPTLSRQVTPTASQERLSCSFGGPLQVPPDRSLRHNEMAEGGNGNEHWSSSTPPTPKITNVSSTKTEQADPFAAAALVAAIDSYMAPPYDEEMGTPDQDEDDNINVAPVTLYPSPLPPLDQEMGTDQAKEDNRTNLAPATLCPSPLLSLDQSSDDITFETPHIDYMEEAGSRSRSRSHSHGHGHSHSHICTSRNETRSQLTQTQDGGDCDKSNSSLERVGKSQETMKKSGKVFGLTDAGDEDDEFSTEWSFGMEMECPSSDEQDDGDDDDDEDDEYEMKRYRKYIKEAETRMSKPLDDHGRDLEKNKDKPMPSWLFPPLSRGSRRKMALFIFLVLLGILIRIELLWLWIKRSEGNDNTTVAIGDSAGTNRSTPSPQEITNLEGSGSGVVIMSEEGLEKLRVFGGRPLLEKVPPGEAAVELLASVTPIDALRVQPFGDGRHIPPLPQQRAMDWIVTDDPFFFAYNQNGREKSEVLKFEDASLVSGIFERYALATLYSATGGEKWTNAKNWLSPYHICDWHGITCGEGRTVLEIDLSSNEMRGELPPELGGAALKDLLKINLNYNNLWGRIPMGLGQTNLREMHMAGNKLSGPLPQDLAYLSNLTAIDLSNNEIGGTLPRWIGRLVNLADIRLSNNRIGGDLDGLDLEKLDKVAVLRLDKNEVKGTLPDSLRKLKALRVLNLSRNRINGVIDNTIGALENLVDLDLSHNQLEGIIPPSVGKLVQLQRLTLSENRLLGFIPESITALKELQELRIDGNAFQGKIPPWIDNLVSMKKLFLNDNSFSGNVPAEIASLTRLSELTLEKNPLLVGQIPRTLCDLDLRLLTADCGGDDQRVDCSCCTSCGLGTSNSTMPQEVKEFLQPVLGTARPNETP